MLFKNRLEAGQKLSLALAHYKERKDVVVLGLARGGVVVAAEVAKALHLALNVVVVRKIGAPGNHELALGAIAEFGRGVFNEPLMQRLCISLEDLKEEIKRQREILKQRLALYRGCSAKPDLKDKIAILVDDGMATGASMRVAVESVKDLCKKVVVALPVASRESLDEINRYANEVVCLYAPSDFGAVGCFYREFKQVLDEEVVSLIS